MCGCSKSEIHLSHNRLFTKKSDTPQEKRFLWGVYQQWQNYLGKVREEKGKIKLVLEKSGITPKYPRGWGWVTGSRGRVGPSLAARERIKRVSRCRPHGCDQRGNCWVVRLQRFWRKSSFVALTWKIEKQLQSLCYWFILDLIQVVKSNELVSGLNRVG